MDTHPFEAERRAAREGALVHLRPDLGAFAVTGRDRQTWLNGLITCELATRKPGEGAYGLAVGKTGKILVELWFLIASDLVIVVAAREKLGMLREHFEKHLIMEDAEMSEPLDRAVVFTHGPRSADLVARARSLGAEAALIDWTGRGDAAVLLAPEGSTGPFNDALLTELGDRGAIAGAEAWEAVRIEWGLPRFGVDFDDQTLPQEASLEKVAVSFTKGCYLGQETVFMLEKRGHAKKRLMRLHVEGAPDLAPGAEIQLPEGGAVGAVTSVTPAPEGGVLALGYVKYKHANAGVALTVAGSAAKVLGTAADIAPRPAV